MEGVGMKDFSNVSTGLHIFYKDLIGQEIGWIQTLARSSSL